MHLHCMRSGFGKLRSFLVKIPLVGLRKTCRMSRYFEEHQKSIVCLNHLISTVVLWTTAIWVNRTWAGTYEFSCGRETVCHQNPYYTQGANKKTNPKPLSAQVLQKKSKGSLKRDTILKEKHQDRMAMRKAAQKQAQSKKKKRKTPRTPASKKHKALAAEKKSSFTSVLTRKKTKK